MEASGREGYLYRSLKLITHYAKLDLEPYLEPY